MKKINKKKSDQKFYTFLSVFFILTLVLGMIAMMLIMKPGKRFDMYYCYKLQDQAEDYKNFLYSKNNTSGFYVTKTDMQMCLDYGIEIKAPVK